VLTKHQATAVARYLVANAPGASSGYLDHGYETAWELACDALEALGYATEAPRGARLIPSPVFPSVLPRWDDACCVVLCVAEQLCQLRLRLSWSEPDDKTGPGTADLETAEVLNTLGLTSAGAWTNAATPVLWRTAPEEVRPPTEQEFSAQVDLAIADIPDDIRDQIKSIYEAHDVPVVRDHQLDWVFYLNWRWGDAWLRDDSHGSPMGIFHDSLAQRVRAAVMARAMEA
jgi:hypothetical protein